MARATMAIPGSTTITALDEQVGRLRRTLRELGVADHTMLWFCSDNGPEGREGKVPGSSGGLRWAWIEDRYKLVCQRPAGPGDRPWTCQLFDLHADPGETHGLAGAEQERVRRMSAALTEWVDSVGASAAGRDY